MAQLDNPKSIALLFTGAFLVSVAIITFLNAELESRSVQGSKTRKETVLETIERKIADTIARLREKNAHRRSVLYHILTSGNETRSAGRKLMYFAKEPDDDEKEDDAKSSHNLHHGGQNVHKLRHEKKTRQNWVQTMTNETNSRMPDLGQKPNVIVAGKDGDINLYLKSVNNKTLKWIRWTEKENRTEVKSGSGVQVFRGKLGVHENCYTMNDVLEIIAITCLVNFIFWFIIISCVNFFTRTQKKFSKSYSCESLESIETGSDCEAPSMKGSDGVCRHTLVQDYINSLTVDVGESGGRTLVADGQRSPEKPWPTSGKAAAKRCEETLPKDQLEKGFMDMISLDNVKPFGQKDNKRISTNQPISANSLSMENLIF